MSNAQSGSQYESVNIEQAHHIRMQNSTTNWITNVADRRIYF